MGIYSYDIIYMASPAPAPAMVVQSGKSSSGLMLGGTLFLVAVVVVLILTLGSPGGSK
jgi:hypothetical protein